MNEQASSSDASPSSTALDRREMLRHFGGGMGMLGVASLLGMIAGSLGKLGRDVSLARLDAAHNYPAGDN